MTWSAAALGDLCKIVSGATPKTEEAQFWGGEVPWATPKDLSRLDTEFLDWPQRSITQDGLRSCAASILPQNSVLLSSRAPIGLVAINTRPMATNQGFKSLVPDSQKLNSKFLFHWLKANKNHLQSLGNGATFKEISKAVVERIEIPLPPLDEQRRIAAILDKADALRRKRKRALDLLDGLTQSIFLEMFGDPIENTNGHAVVSLSEIVSSDRKITYGILKPGPDVVDGVPYVRVVDIQNNRVKVDQLRRTTPEIAHEYRRSKLKSGDLLISIRGHVGRMAIAPEECDGANITQDTARLAIKNADAEFIKAQLETGPARHWMDRRTRGAAVKGINLGDLRQFPIIVPKRAEQERFALGVKRLRAKELASSLQLERLNALFASLQSRAFSGQL
ncbi:restriction endonuclease subunit S [Aurantimonas litoralis]|nr:restriction endonuclease subunit S [Aurantimonas litoralis]